MLYLLDFYILATPAALRPKLEQHSIASRFHGKKAVEQSKVNLGETHSVGDSLTTQKLSKQIW